MDAATWILVIEISADWRQAGSRHESSRTRGLTETACLALIQEVRGPRTTAYCYQDGQPDPDWHRPAKPLPPICVECWPPPGRRRA